MEVSEIRNQVKKIYISERVISYAKCMDVLSKVKVKN